MTNAAFQRQLLDRIADRLPRRIGIVQALVQTLDLTAAAAGRIATGEQELTLAQAYRLTAQYGLPDIGQQAGAVSFALTGLHYNVFDLEAYFSRLLAELDHIDVYGPRTLYYAAADFPVFLLFQFPELAAFKMYFWARTVYGLPGLQDRPFDTEDLNLTALEGGTQAWQRYLKIPSVEIWHPEVVHRTLEQLGYAAEHRFFEDRADVAVLCDTLQELLRWVERQAAQSRKYKPGNYPPKRENYYLYLHETAVHNNAILFSSPDVQRAFVMPNTLDFLATAHPTYCAHTEAQFKRIRQGAIPLYGDAAQATRQAVFEGFRMEVQAVRDALYG